MASQSNPEGHFLFEVVYTIVYTRTVCPSTVAADIETVTLNRTHPARIVNSRLVGRIALRRGGNDVRTTEAVS